jgi:hypothetical protein
MQGSTPRPPGDTFRVSAAWLSWDVAGSDGSFGVRLGVVYRHANGQIADTPAFADLIEFRLSAGRRLAQPGRGRRPAINLHRTTTLEPPARESQVRNQLTGELSTCAK